MSDGVKISQVLTELETHGTYASVTEGASMRPLFKTHRDVVILKKPDSLPKKYDVVLYDSGVPGKFLLHRIVGEKSDCFLIRGDNTFVLERVKKDRILAVLTEFNRAGKHHSTSELGFRIYSRVWNFIYPIRYLLNRLRRLAAKILRKLKILKTPNR